MEWYWVVALIIGFFGVAGVFVWLGKTGRLNKQYMSAINTVVSSLTSAVSAIASATDNTVIDNFSIAMTLIEKSVYAAQNAWYNDEISAEERTDKCMENFNAMLKAAGITLTQAQTDVVSVLIKAACEEMGHGDVEAKEAAEADAE